MIQRIIAIVQARMSSSRLPGKVLAPLGGVPLIAFMLQRLRKCTEVDRVILATSTDVSDDALAAFIEASDVVCYRGDLEDVLGRFSAAARKAEADIIVRLTGDCPLIDPSLVDAAICHLVRGGYDYVSNVAPATFPDGLDVEVFTRAALESADANAVLKSDREHVTPYIRRPENGFSVGNIVSKVDLSGLRWTVDYADDLAFVQSIVDALGDHAVEADRFDILREVCRDNDLGQAFHARNEGYASSLADDPRVERASIRLDSDIC